MKEFFAGQKRDITDFLNHMRMKKKEDLRRVHPMGADSVERILDFTSRGKMIRGGLVSLAYLLTRGDSRGDSREVPRGGVGTAGISGEGSPGNRAPSTTMASKPVDSPESPVDPPEAVVAAGAAMELFQSGFLIHDDIMDRDEMRRGAVSV